MQNPFHKIALYTATILISALPFTPEVAKATDIDTNVLEKRRMVVAHTLIPNAKQVIKK